MPAVTALGVGLRVAGMAEEHQVLVSMVTALCQRLDVMHLLRLDEPAFLLALLIKRVYIHVPVTDAFPCPAVPALGFRIPAVLFVQLVLYSLMFLSEPAVR